MKKFVFKICSIILAVAVMIAGTVTATFTVSAETTADAIIAAAKAYVLEKQNNVKPADLLAAVQKVDASVTLDTAKDFFIKHAVPGVTDNDTTSGYKLDIPGSDGAVAAVFELGGERIGFTAAFAHEKEVIEISEVAVVGTSEGFEFDGKNVIGYTGTADKIIFPKGYYGTMTELSDKTSVNNVEVVVIDTDDPNNNYSTCVRMKENAFKGWSGLKAVQFGANVHPRLLFNNQQEPYKTSYDTNVPYIFADCANLKYAKLPKKLYGAKYILPIGLFENCKALENVILPTEGDCMPMATRAFAYTSVWDFFFTPVIKNTTNQSNAFYGGKCRAESTGQVITYETAMTFCRAAALAAAKANELSAKVSLEQATVETDILAAVTGSSDVDTFKASLSGSWNDSWVETEDGINAVYTLTYGTDSIPVTVTSASKNLKALSVKGYELTPEFDANVNEYSLVVPNGTTSLEVIAEAESGVDIAVSGNEALNTGINTITVTVSVEGETVSEYKITVVVRNESAVVEDIKQKAAAYVSEKKNELTPAELLAKIKESYPEITLDTENDFFIKHAVPGVIDDDTTSGYRLNIAGSAGAVSAVFALNGERITFVEAFGFETEVINIGEVAIAGVSDGFEYVDATVSGQSVKYVTNYTGTADKIVFPADKAITMGAKDIQTAGAFNNVKVVIIDTDDTTAAGKATRLQGSAFNEWQELRAVQFTENAHPRLLIDNISGKYKDGCVPYIFANSLKLKYVKLFEEQTGFMYALPTGIFENCVTLENVNIPTHDSGKNLSIAIHSFSGTAVRDFFLPQYVVYGTDVFIESSFEYGTRNIITYNTGMTFTRALALAAAAAYETDELNSTAAEIKILSAISGSADAVDFESAIERITNVTENDTHVNGTVTVSYNGDSADIKYTAAKTGVADVNEDGNVNILDLIRTKKIFAAGNNQQVKALDIDGDLIVSLADMVLLRKTLLGAYVIPETNAMYVNWENEELKVVQKYSSEKDFVMVMKKLGGNNIFNIASPLAIKNTGKNVSSDIASAVVMDNLGTSDWFGPHKVYAKQDKNGDNTGAWTYTGGAHNYNNNANYGETGVTGRTANIVVKADGNEVQSGFSDYADSLVVTWDNYIQAFNTMKADGTGREVLVEHHTVTFDGITWYTETEIEFLENVGWSEYYGNQCVVNSIWNERIKYGSQNWQSMSADTKASEEKCERMILNGDNDYLEMYLDSSYGLGDRSYLGADVSAYHKHYGNDKAYFNLVDGDYQMTAGTKVAYRGYYRFFTID